MTESVAAVLLLVLHTLLAVLGAGHALIYKRDSRSALGWVGMCLVFPLFGTLLYFVFGINRVRTQAQRLSRESPFQLGIGYERGDYDAQDATITPESVDTARQPLARLSRSLTRRPLLEGNAIEPLHNGESAYPAMLDAIDRAQSHVYLSTYIFETNQTGRRFIDALANAERRGVDVRVLLDGIGELYSLPLAGQLLQQRGVRVERFLRPHLWPPKLDINLRNHRKILTVDDDEGFLGGMNIGDRHLVGAQAGRHPVVDLHFHLRGPIVTQLETVFAEDWRFVTREVLQPPPLAGRATEGQALCRAFTEGPNEDLDTLSLVLNGAISGAHTQIDIMTPYFIPPAALVTALQTAALRGVRIRILLPGKNNLRYVHWATRNLLGELLAFGIEVYYQPPPFVHTKLFVVDGHYTLIGSANIDTRSLRLNFELATEILDAETAATLTAHCDRAVAHSRAITGAEIDGRSLPARIRDSACWLFSPYL